jgi:hypothetical protein
MRSRPPFLFLVVDLAADYFLRSNQNGIRILAGGTQADFIRGVFVL